MWREKVPGILLGMQIGYSHYENQYGDLKKLRIKLPYDQAIPLLGLYPQIIKNRVSKREVYIPMHSSISHHSQKLEATQVFANI